MVTYIHRCTKIKIDIKTDIRCEICTVTPGFGYGRGWGGARGRDRGNYVNLLVFFIYSIVTKMMLLFSEKESD